MDEKRIKQIEQLHWPSWSGAGPIIKELIQALREAQAENEQLKEAASAVFNWYYIFGENNYAARVRLANLGNALNRMGIPGARTQKDKTLEDKCE